jgi:hypothetical protein
VSLYTAERQASRDVSLGGLRLKPGSSHYLADATKSSHRKRLVQKQIANVVFLFIIVILIEVL